MILHGNLHGNLQRNAVLFPVLRGISRVSPLLDNNSEQQQSLHKDFMKIPPMFRSEFWILKMPKHLAKHMLGHRTKHEAKAEVSRICTRPSQVWCLVCFWYRKYIFQSLFWVISVWSLVRCILKRLQCKVVSAELQPAKQVIRTDVALKQHAKSASSFGFLELQELPFYPCSLCLCCTRVILPHAYLPYLFWPSS